MPATLSAHAPQVSDRLGSYHVPARGTAAYWLSPMERSQLVKQGVPAREVVALADAMAVPRDQLEYALWGEEPPDGDMLRSHIYELRRSVDGPFAEKLLHTLPRVGYRLCAPAPAGGR